VSRRSLRSTAICLDSAVISTPAPHETMVLRHFQLRLRRLTGIHASHLSREKHEFSGRAVESELLVRSRSAAVHVCLSAVGPACRTGHPFASNSEEPLQKIESVFSASPPQIADSGPSLDPCSTSCSAAARVSPERAMPISTCTRLKPVAFTVAPLARGWQVWLGLPRRM
jgi:hypothetical protein